MMVTNKTRVSGIVKYMYMYLKVLNQSDFFPSFISNLLGEKSNLPSINCNMLARLCNFCM